MIFEPTNGFSITLDQIEADELCVFLHIADIRGWNVPMALYRELCMVCQDPNDLKKHMERRPNDQ